MSKLEVAHLEDVDMNYMAYMYGMLSFVMPEEQLSNVAIEEFSTEINHDLTSINSIQFSFQVHI